MTPVSLLDLPPELRLYIYRYIFEGSLFVVCAGWCSTRNKHPGILLACKLCRLEAHGIFWQESRIKICERYGSCHHKHIFELGYGLNDFAKTHIKHIRGRRCDRTSKLYQWPNCFSVRDVVRQFPKLETYQIAHIVHDTGPPNYLVNWDDLSMYEWILNRHMRMDPPKFFQKKHRIDPAASTVTFFVGVTLIFSSIEGEVVKEKTFWINFKTNKFIVSPPHGSVLDTRSMLDIERELLE